MTSCIDSIRAKRFAIEIEQGEIEYSRQRLGTSTGRPIDDRLGIADRLCQSSKTTGGGQRQQIAKNNAQHNDPLSRAVLAESPSRLKSRRSPRTDDSF